MKNQKNSEKKVKNQEKELKNELRRYKNINKNYKVLFIIIAVILIVLIILSTGFALVNINNENMIAGVKIDKVNIQGLSKQSATNLITEKIEDKLDNEIKIKIDNEEQGILLSQIELEYDVQKAIEEAFSIGRSGNIFVNNFNIIKSKIFGADINLDFHYNDELLNNMINDISSKIPNAVTQATYSIEDENLIISRGKAGNTIDTNELKNKILEDIHIGNSNNIEINTIHKEPEEIDIQKIYDEVHKEVQDAYYTTNPFQVYPEVEGIDFNIEEAKKMLEESKEEYIIPLIITKPSKTIREIGTEAFPDLLGTFSTRYDESVRDRSTNLKLAVSKINGVVVMPGETFSYNKTLGKRTVEAGFKDAAGYSGGKVVQMIGGGICQISSTLYDAVVYANLEIVERHNHAFLTSYVGAGKDATVVYGALDFQFKNTRKYPITIKANAQNGIARVDIYGIREDVEYDIEISSTILNYITYKVIYENDSSLAAGTEKVTQSGMNGCKSITYKIFKLNGAEVSRTVLSTDTYDPMNKYISRGVKATANPSVPSTPTTPSTQETPTTPETPTEPEQPETPEAPTEPETPQESEENNAA